MQHVRNSYNGRYIFFSIAGRGTRLRACVMSEALAFPVMDGITIFMLFLMLCKGAKHVTLVF